ncbi:MAG TPA: heme-binding protein [Solirubrobacteraceae bacterium]|jgi:hypothetical protein|nr:heme-binding protein [Solirubrobacteraceae bacterium]
MASRVDTARVPSVRIAPDSETVLKELGLLKDMPGSWQGHGFNLIARPDREGEADLYLELNQTDETLKLETIGSPIPNRGLGQDDIELAGLTYLQKIKDSVTGGALHIEPGIWITQPETSYPPEAPPAGEQIVTRLANIPHGNSLLAHGTARRFQGPPTLAVPGSNYAFSAFPSFNSTPFRVGEPMSAAGSSEKDSDPGEAGFTQYDLSVPTSRENPRTPFPATAPPLPATIDGIPMQEVVNDPIKLLQAVIERQTREGCTFEGIALNIATQARIPFFDRPNSRVGKGAPPPSSEVEVPLGAGGIENIPFLKGGEPTGAQGSNALAALVYATFWIETVSHPGRADILQLQYAQMTVLDFAILNALPAVVNLGWPHVSVATLKRTFL